jgi:hypothetical protein
MAVLAPIPSAMVRIAVAENTGLFRKLRKLTRIAAASLAGIDSFYRRMS